MQQSFWNGDNNKNSDNNVHIPATLYSEGGGARIFSNDSDNNKNNNNHNNESKEIETTFRNVPLLAQRPPPQAEARDEQLQFTCRVPDTEGTRKEQIQLPRNQMGVQSQQQSQHRPFSAFSSTSSSSFYPCFSMPVDNAIGPLPHFVAVASSNSGISVDTATSFAIPTSSTSSTSPATTAVSWPPEQQQQQQQQQLLLQEEHHEIYHHQQQQQQRPCMKRTMSRRGAIGFLDRRRSSSRRDNAGNSSNSDCDCTDASCDCVNEGSSTAVSKSRFLDAIEVAAFFHNDDDDDDDNDIDDEDKMSSKNKVEAMDAALPIMVASPPPHLSMPQRKRTRLMTTQENDLSRLVIVQHNQEDPRQFEEQQQERQLQRLEELTLQQLAAFGLCHDRTNYDTSLLSENVDIDNGALDVDKDDDNDNLEDAEKQQPAVRRRRTNSWNSCDG